MTTQIQLPAGHPRVESGPIQFVADGVPDWRGLFLRGDEAASVAIAIGTLLDQPESPLALIYKNVLRGLANDICHGVLGQKPVEPSGEETDGKPEL